MRKYKLPDELARLSDEDLKVLNDWLRRYTYPTVQEKCRQQFGIVLNVNKLCRYYQRLCDVEDINQWSGQSLSVPDLNSIKNGQPLPDEKLNTQLLHYACYKLALRPDNTAADLVDLMQIATYEQRAEITKRRLELAEDCADLNKQKAALKEEKWAYLQSMKASSSTRANQLE